MKLALAQISTDGDVDANLERVLAAIRDAAAVGAELLVLPEASMCAFGFDLAAVAQPLDGPWAEAVRTAARQAGLVVVVGMFTPGDEGRVRNTLLAVGPKLDAHYDKIHLFDAFGYRESDAVMPGNEIVVIRVGEHRVGLATCYDIRFPALFQAHARAGAVLTVVAASWGDGDGKAEQWSVLGRARALDATLFIAAVGQADPRSVGRAPEKGAPSGVGGSQLVSPWGVVLAEAARAPQLLIVEVPAEQVEQARAALPVLENARQDVTAPSADGC